MAAPLRTRLLDPGTFPDFARLIESEKIWGGCWCLGFHDRALLGSGDGRSVKQALVEADRSHAALVYDGADVVGWAQYGCAAELPALKNRREYEANLDRLPDWRLACLYVAKSHRHRGVANAAVAGALAAIAEAGGGVTEAYPEEVEGRKVSGSFLWNGTLPMYERHGFERVRRLGKHKWVVRRVIP